MASIKGGDKFEAKLRELGKLIEKKAKLQVGWLKNATYPDGTPVAMIAAIQEYGAPRASIPPRPAFRIMIDSKKGEWPTAIGGLLRSNGFDPVNALEQTGMAIKGQLQQSIADLYAPPLSPVTLMLRKMRGETPGLVVTGKTVGIAAARVATGESTAGVSTKPLVWTGHLLNSVDYEVTTP